MQRTDRLSKILKDTHLNALISWAMVILLLVLGVVNLADGRLTWSVLIAALLVIIVAPALLLRKLSIMPSWYFVVLAIMPIVGNTTAYHFFFTSIPIYFSVATIALLLAAEINWFTSVRMDSKFAVLLVVITTLAISGLWHLLHWLLDINFDTAFLLDGRSQEAVNAAVMHDFIYATLAGVAAGVIFGWYFSSAKPFKSVVPSSRPSGGTHEDPLPKRPMPIRKLLGISTEKQILATRIMQGGLFLLLIVSILLRDLHTALNAIAGLAITFVPSLITRKYNIVLDAGLTVWITLAIFMDALGTFAFYDNVARWDNLTHTLSASVIAAAGYVLIRAIDIHTEEIYIPPRVMFILILLFVLATGVLWEILEFLTDELTAEFGYKAVLAQHGINDTMRDLSFNLLGAVFTATWGTAYLSDISYRLADRFGETSSRKDASEISEVIGEQRQSEVFLGGLKDKE